MGSNTWGHRGATRGTGCQPDPSDPEPELVLHQYAEAQHRAGLTCKGTRNHMSLLWDPRGSAQLRARGGPEGRRHPPHQPTQTPRVLRGEAARAALPRESTHSLEAWTAPRGRRARPHRTMSQTSPLDLSERGQCRSQRSPSLPTSWGPMEAPANIPDVLRTFPCELGLSRPTDPLQGHRGGLRPGVPGHIPSTKFPRASLRSGHPVQHPLPSGTGRLPVWAPVLETAHEALGKSPVSL